MKRSATFVFFIGDRFFGTVTAYAREPYAARYHYTSAMTVQLLRDLAPDLMPLIAPGRQRPHSSFGLQRDSGPS